jgi:hypothetical protein
VNLISIDESKREVGVVESRGILLWLAPEDLLQKNIDQAVLCSRKDIDNTEIIRDYIKPYV